jgi:excisionase family DNA binding protein
MTKTPTPDIPPMPLARAAVPTSLARAPAPKALPPSVIKPAPAFFTTKQLAARWSISERQVHRFIASGALIATRFGRSVRISAEEAARFEAGMAGK